MAARTLMDVARGATGAYIQNHTVLHRFREDILSDACLGAVQAAASYDPTAGASLNTYAGHRARGAILDGVRDRSPLTRTEHARGKRIDELPAHRQRAASVHDLVDVGWEPAAPGCMEDAVADRDLVDRMLATCTERERIILSANLLHGYTLTAIAEHFGVTVSAISQQRTAAMKRLRGQFSSSWEDAA